MKETLWGITNLLRGHDQPKLEQVHSAILQLSKSWQDYSLWLELTGWLEKRPEALLRAAASMPLAWTSGA
jgi:hypothetical protein